MKHVLSFLDKAAGISFLVVAALLPALILAAIEWSFIFVLFEAETFAASKVVIKILLVTINVLAMVGLVVAIYLENKAKHRKAKKG